MRRCCLSTRQRRRSAGLSSSDVRASAFTAEAAEVDPAVDADADADAEADSARSPGSQFAAAVFTSGSTLGHPGAERGPSLAARCEARGRQANRTRHCRSSKGACSVRASSCLELAQRGFFKCPECCRSLQFLEAQSRHGRAT
jgi:hypothetical protein